MKRLFQKCKHQGSHNLMLNLHKSQYNGHKIKHFWIYSFLQGRGGGGAPMIEMKSVSTFIIVCCVIFICLFVYVYGGGWGCFIITRTFYRHYFLTCKRKFDVEAFQQFFVLTWKWLSTFFQFVFKYFLCNIDMYG